MPRRLPGPVPWMVREGLAVHRLGDGEPVLFMPGPHRFERPGLRAADALIEGLRRQGRMVVTFDPPGSGGSTRPARLGVAEMLDCAGEALAAVGAEGPVDVVGHSMGGLVTIAWALERPARVRRLVLIGTGSGGPAYRDAPGALWRRGHPRYGAMARLGLLQLVVPTRAPERMLRNLVEAESFVDRGLARPAPVGLADWFRPREGRTDWQRQARRLDYSGRLGEIRVPCLVLCGRRDPQYPLSASMQLAGRIPGARLVVLERSGHYPFLEEPGPFWSAVAGFLTGDRVRTA